MEELQLDVFISGAMSEWIDSETLIRYGLLTIGVGLAAMILVHSEVLSLIGLILIGLGCAPSSWNDSFDTNEIWQKSIPVDYWTINGVCICGQYFHAADYRWNVRAVKFYNVTLCTYVIGRWDVY